MQAVATDDVMIGCDALCERAIEIAKSLGQSPFAERLRLIENSSFLPLVFMIVN
jgi:hypothetical protein